MTLQGQGQAIETARTNG